MSVLSVGLSNVGLLILTGLLGLYMLGCYLLDNMPHATTNEDIPLKKTNEDIENMKKKHKTNYFFQH